MSFVGASGDLIGGLVGTAIALEIIKTVLRSDSHGHKYRVKVKKVHGKWVEVGKRKYSSGNVHKSHSSHKSRRKKSSEETFMGMRLRA